MQRSARSLKMATIAAGIAAIVSGGAMADSLSVRLDKAEILRLDVPASIVIVGNPQIADVTVENPNMLFVTGLTAGETNLIILDENGDAIMDYDLVVVSEIDRTITVHRSVDLLSTYSCRPRCIEIANPSEVERQRQFSEAATEDDDAADVEADETDDTPDEEANADSGGSDEAG